MPSEHDPPILEQFKASAGSGKTFKLTGRFLELMRRRAGLAPAPACGAEAGDARAWPEIMAVTFTNKAAEQMKTKVVAALKERALGLDDGPQAAGWTSREAGDKLERILRHYHRLNVRTIDSLLHLIVRVFALPLGVTPDFDVVFDLDEMLEVLLDETIAGAERGDPVEREMIGAAVDSLLYIDAVKGFAPAARIRKRLGAVLKHMLSDPAPLDNDAAELGARIHAAAAALKNAARNMAAAIEEEGLDANSNFLGFLDKIDNLLSGGAPPKSAYASKDFLDECLNKKSRGKCSGAAEGLYSAVCRAYADYVHVLDNLSGARSLAAFVTLGRYMAGRLYEHQQRLGVMLHDTLPVLASEALSGGAGAPDAFCRLGTRLSAVLVDEFQDTSRKQWEALKPLAWECLSSGGRLFIVGDVKQAVYGWRGGDARLFDEVTDDPELTAVGEVRRDRLKCNWRSLAAVIGFNNDVFAGLAEPEAARRLAGEMIGPDSAGMDQLSGSIASAFADAFQENPPGKDNSGGHVKLTRVRGENKDDLIENVRGELESVLIHDLLPRRAPGDVAVLVRTNKEASLVSEWLIGWGAPVVTENSLRLDRHPLIRELLSALAFLDYPLNDTAFFEFVSGGRLLHPIGGPRREDLFAWLAAESGGGPLYRRFSRDYPEVWERLVAPFVRRAGLMGPYDTVSELMRAYGLIERFSEDEAFLRRFLEVVFAAEQSGRLSLSSFIEYWNESGPEEKAPLPEHVNAVRVLTIHKAKGLEFPAVVVPFHHWLLMTNDDIAVHEFEGRRLLAPLRKGLGRTYDLAVAPMLQEQLNLLYVAWTRPREELYCLLTSAPYFDGKSPVGKALDFLLEDLDFYEDERGMEVFELGEPPVTPTPPKREPRAPKPRPSPEPGAAAEPMSWLPRLKIHRNLSRDISREELLSPGPVFDEKTRGEVFHAALDLASGKGAGLGPKALASRALAACAAPYPETAAKEIAEALEWVLGHAELSTYLAAGAPEASIMDENGKLHRPDLLAQGDFGTAIVEYKTGGERSEHLDQVQRYMGLARGAGGYKAPLFGVIAYLDLKRLARVED